MRKQISLDQAVGKTIYSKGCDRAKSRFIITFTDDSFVLLTPLYDVYDESTVIESDLQFDPFEFNDDSVIVSAGVMTSTELSLWYEEYYMKCEQEQQQKEFMYKNISRYVRLIMF